MGEFQELNGVFGYCFQSQLNLFYVYPLVELEAHAQLPRDHLVPLDSGDERVNPIQQQLGYDFFSKVLDAAIQPTLEQIRGIRLQCSNQFSQQEQGDAGVLSIGQTSLPEVFPSDVVVRHGQQKTPPLLTGMHPKFF